MVRLRTSEAGVTLVELMIILGLLIATLGVVFGVVQVLTSSAGSTTKNSTAANDISFNMGQISKSIMGSKLLYASDSRIVVLDAMSGGRYEMETVYATSSPDPSSDVGRLVWERWSCDASGTAPTGGHVVWAVSENNANLKASPVVPLFTYYRNASDASIMGTSSADKSGAPDSSVSAFCGVLPGGYTVGVIGRVRLNVATRFTYGIRTDARDIFLRVR